MRIRNFAQRFQGEMEKRHGQDEERQRKEKESSQGISLKESQMIQQGHLRHPGRLG
jgi:hypothetical protein